MACCWSTAFRASLGDSMVVRQEHFVPTRKPMIGAVLCMLIGPIVWAIHFTMTYATHTLLCTGGIASSEGRGFGLTALAVSALTIIALAALLIAGAAPRVLRRRGKAFEECSEAFLARVMRSLILLSAFAIAITGATALILVPCVALR